MEGEKDDATATEWSDGMFGTYIYKMLYQHGSVWYRDRD